MKPFTTIAAVIFALIAFVHILRVSMRASAAGLVIAAGRTVMLLREARK
jgi:hypothetical protein